MRLMIPLLFSLALGACGDASAPKDAPADAPKDAPAAKGQKGKAGKAGKAGKKKPTPTCPTSAELATALTESALASTVQMTGMAPEVACAGRFAKADTVPPEGGAVTSVLFRHADGRWVPVKAGTGQFCAGATPANVATKLGC
jgi:hypothetical protein